MDEQQIDSKASSKERRTSKDARFGPMKPNTFVDRWNGCSG